jgi:hypothetical protein
MIHQGVSMRILLGALALTLAAPASAAALITNGTGFTGTGLDLTGFTGFYDFTAGPVALPGGITYTSTSSSSVIGTGGYGLNENGVAATTPIIGTNGTTNTITLTFANPVSAFGAGFSYAVIGNAPVGTAPVISAFDINGSLIASYDLEALAPIRSNGANEFFLFRGIDGQGTGIKSFTMTGGFIIAAGTFTNAAIPEPASWAMLIAGFGLTGAVMRRRRAAIA